MIKRFLILVSLCSIAAVPLEGKYPREVIYNAGTSSTGSPLIKSNSWDGPLDSLKIMRLSRFPVIGINVDPAGNIRPDIVSTLRHYNPNIRVIFYTLVGYHWVKPSSQGGSYPESSNQWNAQRWRIIENTNGWLYGTDGNVWFDNYNVNLGNRATVDSLANFILSVERTHIGDGWWLDDFHAKGISWTNGSMGRILDVKRAGFVSLAQLDSAFFVNTQRFVDTIRGTSPNTIIFCNGCDGLNSIDGAMREGIDSGGGLPDAAAAIIYNDTTSYKNPTLKDEGAWNGNWTYSLEYANLRRNLAFTCFGHGLSNWSPNNNGTVVPYFGEWWADEYAVRPYPYTIADTSGKYVGWLGGAGDTLVYKWVLETDYIGHTRLVPQVMLRWFDNGCVMLNRSTTPYTFKLWATFKRILGRADPYTNNGREAQSFTVPSNDALFVVRKPRPKP